MNYMSIVVMPLKSMFSCYLISFVWRLLNFKVLSHFRLLPSPILLCIWIWSVSVYYFEIVFCWHTVLFSIYFTRSVNGHVCRYAYMWECNKCSVGTQLSYVCCCIRNFPWKTISIVQIFISVEVITSRNYVWTFHCVRSYSIQKGEMKLKITNE